MYDVLIIGCGITGAATAFELAKYRLRVGIVERENDVALGTTKANSAILHAGYDPEPGTLMARLNVRGVELARELCALNRRRQELGQERRGKRHGRERADDAVDPAQRRREDQPGPGQAQSRHLGRHIQRRRIRHAVEQKRNVQIDDHLMTSLSHGRPMGTSIALSRGECCQFLSAAEKMYVKYT